MFKLTLIAFVVFQFKISLAAEISSQTGALDTQWASLLKEVLIKGTPYGLVGSYSPQGLGIKYLIPNIPTVTHTEYYMNIGKAKKTGSFGGSDEVVLPIARIEHHIKHEIYDDLWAVDVWEFFLNDRGDVLSTNRVTYIKNDKQILSRLIRPVGNLEAQDKWVKARAIWYNRKPQIQREYDVSKKYYKDEA